MFNIDQHLIVNGILGICWNIDSYFLCLRRSFQIYYLANTMLHQTACPSTYIGIVEIINITSTNFVIIMLKAMRTSHIAENLLNRDFTGLRAKKVLLTDITYIPCNGVFFYLSTILDAFT